MRHHTTSTTPRADMNPHHPIKALLILIGWALITSTSPASAQPVNPGFEDGLNNWTVTSYGAQAIPGDVQPVGGAAELREGDAFQVTLRQTFPFDAPLQSLSFTVALNPGFDAAQAAIPDAFEVSLLDGAGQPLAVPWKLGASSFFNMQEDGAIHTGSSTTFDGNQVTVDLRGTPVGLGDVTLIFSLIGGDGDTGSAVRVDDVDLTLADGDPLDPVRDAAAGLCLQVEQTMSVYGPGDLPFDAGSAPRAVEVCHKGITCLNNDPAQLGCYLLALVNVHKLVLNVERDSVNDHTPLRAALVEHAHGLLAHVQATWENNKPTSHQRGGEALADVTGASGIAMVSAEDAFFWFDDARRPFGSIDDGEGTCASLAILLGEAGDYADSPDNPAAAEVSVAMLPMMEGRALLCETGLEPNAPCYDRNFLTGLSTLMDAASALKNLRDAEVGDDSTLVWTRNWQLGISRVAQYWLNLSLDNLQRWVEAGGVQPGYAPILLEANTSWGDAEVLLDDGALDTFIARFTDPAAKCLMYDAYEFVDDWWLDASDATCPGGAVPYPAACFDDAGNNLWPLHQVRVAGE